MIITYGSNALSKELRSVKLAGGFAELGDRLQKAARNQGAKPGKDADIPWWSPARFDSTASRKGQAPEWSCLVLDYDGAALPSYLDNFNRILYQTRNSTDDVRRWRVVINVTEPIPAAMVPRVVALFAGADPKAALPTQVFFMPKAGSTVVYSQGERYDWRAALGGDFSDLLAMPAPAPAPAPGASTMRYEDVIGALAQVDPDCGYDDWVRVGMALHAELGPADGFATWLAWSKTGRKFKGQGDLDVHWRSFTAGGGVTGQTLLQMVPASGDDFPVIAPTPKPAMHYLTPAGLLLPRELPEFLVDGLLEQDSECSVIGPTGSYKSLFAFELGVCVATGEPFFGRETKQGLVVMLIGEGAGGIARRAQGLKNARGLDFTNAPLAIYPRPMSLATNEGVKAMRDMIAEAEAQFGQKLALLVIDTYSRYGKGDEDKTGDTYDFFKAVRAIRGAASVIVCHHTGHGDKSRARGSSAWGQLVDTEFVAAIQDDGSRRFNNTKQKDGESCPPFSFTLRTVPTELTRRGGQKIESVVLEPAIIPVVKDEAAEETVEPVGKNQTIMLHAVRGLNGHPIEMVLDQAVDTMDRGTSAQDQRRTGAKRALQRLQTLGLVEIRDDKVFVTEFK